MCLQIVIRNNHKNLGVKYAYTLPSNTSDETVYYWKLSDFTPCTKTCGNGTQHRRPICHRRLDGLVNDTFCWSNAKNHKPDIVSRSCNEEPCPAYWWIGPWQPCACHQIGW